MAYETASWLAEIPFGSLVWARLNPSQMIKGEAKLYPAVFVGWVILPGSTVTRDIWVLPWGKLQKALETQSFRGRSSLRRSREYFRP
eukprot:6473944-Amphidinium_carterae.1